MNKIISSYNTVGDELFYHRTRSDADGNEYYYGTEVHAQHELLFLVEGRISYVIEGQSYTVMPGDMIFVAPGEIHALKIDGRYPYERIVLLFDFEIIRPVMTRLDASLAQFSNEGSKRFHVIKKETVDRYGLADILCSITALDGEEKYKRLSIATKLIELAISIDKIAAEAASEPQTPNSEDTLVRAAISYINSHLTEKISLDELATALFVSKSSLCHRFSSYLKISPSKYIAYRKIQYANRLLSEGYTAAAAATAVGYESYSAFYYSYRRIMNKAPSES